MKNVLTMLLAIAATLRVAGAQSKEGEQLIEATSEGLVVRINTGTQVIKNTIIATNWATTISAFAKFGDQVFVAVSSPSLPGTATQIHCFKISPDGTATEVGQPVSEPEIPIDLEPFVGGVAVYNSNGTFREF